jgi:hypothetical protein
VPAWWNGQWDCGGSGFVKGRKRLTFDCVWRRRDGDMEGRRVLSSLDRTGGLRSDMDESGNAHGYLLSSVIS